MTRMLPLPSLNRSANERGQVVVIFAVAFAVVVMMLALLFDGARGIVLRRQLQDASDASALAAANVIQSLTPKSCSTTGGAGTAQAAVVTAAKNSVSANLPSYDVNNVVVTCTDKFSVSVSLTLNSQSFFAGIFGTGPLVVQTRSVAINGSDGGNNFSVVLLDPAHYAWPNNYQGCPSFAFNGSITANFDSAIYVDSACDVGHGGAFATKGGSATLTMGNGAAIHLVGEFKAQSLNVTPAPMEHQGVKKDPLAGLVAPLQTDIYQQSGSQVVLTGSGQSRAFNPGVYVGGIQLKSNAKAYFRPGIYFIKGGGLQLGSQSELYTIPANLSSTTAATWSTDCLATNCGVLIYYLPNTNAPASDQIIVAAGATLKVRSYGSAFDTTKAADGVTPYSNSTYDKILFWQNATPLPTSSWQQPIMQLQGGGAVEMSGTVYAPSAKILMQGGAGGSGGGVDLTIQFIAWDLELGGNASFHFIYDANFFATPTAYGLIE